MGDRELCTIIKSPPEQNPKLKIKETRDEIKPLNEYEKCLIVFDDSLVSPKIKNIDQFIIGGRHHNLDIFYLSQSYLDLPKRTKREKSNYKICLIRH